MGITIHYRGQLADPERLEELEDRVVDLALLLGARARIWRIFAEHDHGRRVGGVLLELAPGVETVSLLVSPEGWLPAV